MQNRIVHQYAFVLHSRPYLNSSLIVELFTQEYGRVSVVARSARGPKSRYRGMLQSFTPLLISWYGRHELKTLGETELAGLPHNLKGDALLCGFYLNELLMRLLHREDPYSQLFEFYESSLRDLSSSMEIQPVLRRFEKRLLYFLGYGLPLLRDAQSGEFLSADLFYQYLPDRGFVFCDPIDDGMVFSGKSLIEINLEHFNDPVILRDAKRLMRIILTRHLGDKPLKSREMLT